MLDKTAQNMFLTHHYEIVDLEVSGTRAAHHADHYRNDRKDRRQTHRDNRRVT